MSNRLGKETSPYLLQHVNNPVDWYPWGEEALTLSIQLDKPILLSIGFSSCHWCHVMAHESFEDAEVAAVMNQHFVNIKVDREERPDPDQIYQIAHQMLAQRGGGWPLTMFLTPSQVPFFSGTYFPKQQRYQMPGFLDLLPRVAEFYLSHKAEISAQNLQMFDAFKAAAPQVHAGIQLTLAPLADAARDLASQFDPVWGGFGRAPKFPRPSELEFALRYAAHGPLGEMALFTLSKMEQGGIYDQLGGGFYRYSVDERWAIPHFEKMLYDNGPLLGLFADAFALTGNSRFKQVCEETVGWLVREMQAPDGGFYSALDADSEHEEGKFYVWTQDEVKQALTFSEYAIVESHYGLDQAANFENTHWHLIVTQILPSGQDQALIDAKAKLFALREARVRPSRDEKVLVSWNALMIKAIFRAARICERPKWTLLAQRALDFIRVQMWRNDRLLATYKDGKAKLNAYLDDYAFLLDALLESLQVEFRAQDLSFAQELADRLLSHFEDPEQGGFFFTSHDHERLIHRPKPGPDQATPSGNGIAVSALQRLGHLLGEPRYIAAAERALTLFYPAISSQPAVHTTLLAGLKQALEPPDMVVVRGPAQHFHAWRAALASAYLPNALIIFLPNRDVDGTTGLMFPLPVALAKPETAVVNAWVCRGVKCLSAVSSPAALISLCKAPLDD